MWQGENCCSYSLSFVAKFFIMLKKILVAALVCSSIVACKKDDGGGGGGSSSGPQVTAASFISNHSPGSINNGYRLDSGIIAWPTAGESKMYNYANITMGAAWKDTFKTPTNTVDFSGATYMSDFTQNLLGQNVGAQRYFQLNTSSWYVMGSDISQIAVTVPGTGSMTLPKQASKQNPYQLMANFPITYNDSTGQNTSSSITGTATITALGQTGTLTIKQDTKVSTKNFAWGTLKLKGYTDSMQTVVQRYTTDVTTTVSSTNFFIQAAIPTILSSYGLTNGQTISLTTYRFWVPGKGLVMTLQADGSATVTTGL